MEIPEDFDFEKANRIIELLDKEKDNDNPIKKTPLDAFNKNTEGFEYVGVQIEKLRIISGTRKDGYYLNNLSNLIIRDFGGQLDLFNNYSKSLNQTKRIADLTERLINLQINHLKDYIAVFIISSLITATVMFLGSRLL